MIGFNILFFQNDLQITATISNDLLLTSSATTIGAYKEPSSMYTHFRLTLGTKHTAFQLAKLKRHHLLVTIFRLMGFAEVAGQLVVLTGQPITVTGHKINESFQLTLLNQRCFQSRSVHVKCRLHRHNPGVNRKIKPGGKHPQLLLRSFKL